MFLQLIYVSVFKHTTVNDVKLQNNDPEEQIVITTSKIVIGVFDMAIIAIL